MAMVIHGKNLLISTDGQVLAASKSCTLNIGIDTIPISSPNDGQWEHSLTARKSWAVKTNHLLTTVAVPDGKITAQSYGFTGATPRVPSYVTDGAGHTIQTVSRGISAIRISNVPPYNFLDTEFTTWDTYADPDATDIIAYLTNNTDCIIAMVCSDAFAMTQDMVNAFVSTGKNVTPPVLLAGRHSMSIICGNIISKGVCSYTENDGKDDPVAGGANAEILMRAGNILTQTPLKDAISAIGKSFTLRVEVKGFPYDFIEGQAICKTYNVNANIGSLVQGNFEFIGNGALE